MKQNTFLEKCKAIALVMAAFSMILFGAAALVYSASPAKADNGPQMTNGTGKYQMELSTILKNSATYWYILVYNTETGRSKFYYGSTEVGTKSASSAYNLPSSPL